MRLDYVLKIYKPLQVQYLLIQLGASMWLLKEKKIDLF